MSHRFRSLRPAILCAAGVALLLGTSPAAAEAQDRPDFLFQRPWVTLGLRAGYALPTADSDVFEDAVQFLTLEKSDFRSAAFGAELAVRATERLDVALDFIWSRSSTRSEDREFIGEDDLPIEQMTRFTRVPVSLSVRGYLFERGRSISRFAWVPAKWSPYLGAGVGKVWYKWEQEGEFVDYESLDIFYNVFDSEGWATSAHVLAGAEYSLSPRFVLTGEGRYTWATAPLSFEWVGFDDIDLGGLQMTAGISVRF